jgi:hypothetical protein
MIATAKLLFDTYPEAVTKVEQREETVLYYPLHLAARWWPLELVQMIYNALPAAIHYRASREYATVLHAAACRCEVELFDFIFDKRGPTVCSIIDGHLGYLPFHCAVMSQHANVKILERLYDAYPAAIGTPIGDGDYILHELIYDYPNWSDDDIDFESTLHFLLKRNPEAVHNEVGHYGSTVYEVADSEDLEGPLRRLLLLAAVPRDPDYGIELADLNYQGRRSALSLLFAPDIEIPGDGSTLIWRLLRDCGEPGIMKTIVMLL